jgi:hypothetical protein
MAPTTGMTYTPKMRQVMHLSLTRFDLDRNKERRKIACEVFTEIFRPEVERVYGVGSVIPVSL